MDDVQVTNGHRLQSYPGLSAAEADPVPEDDVGAVPVVPAQSHAARAAPAPAPADAAEAAHVLDPEADDPGDGLASIFHRPWTYDADPVLKPIWLKLRSGEQQPDYWISNNRLICLGKTCVPAQLVKDVIMEYHRANHASFMKTLLLLKRSFHFAMTDKALARLCEDLIKRCHVCQAVKKKTNTRHGTLDYVPIPEDIFSSLCMDFVQFPSCKDLEDNIIDSVFVVVCRLSGYVLGIPCKKEGLTAERMAALYLKNVVAVFGLPHEIMSDCDHLINSKFMNTLCALSGVTQHVSIIYRPKGNGRAEAAVRLVVDMLRRTLAELPTSWPQALPWALWQLNELPGVDGAHSPHTIVFGREPIGLGDAPQFRLGRSSDLAEKWFEKIQHLRQNVQRKIQDLHAKLTQKFKETHVCKEYRRGDRVWVRNLPHEGNKLDPLWTGPCEILDRIGNRGRYQVGIQDQVVDVHADRLKMYLPHVDGTKIVLNYYKPQTKVPEDDTYVVEKIMEHRTRNGKCQWKVNWQGYDHSYDTWEPASSFVGHLQQDWMDYNRRHHLEVPLTSLIPDSH